MSDVLSSPTNGAELKNTVVLLGRLFPPPRDFVIRLWDGSELPAANHPYFTLVH